MENVVNTICVLLLVLVIGQNVYFRRQCKKLKDLAFLDPLTNLFTRRFLEGEIAKIYDNRPTQVAVMMLDVNNFKHINDTHGHQAGDKTLVMIAAALKKSVRPGDFVFRYAGDEFLICFPLGDDLAKLEAITKRIKLRVEIMSLSLGFGESVTVSCGVAVRTESETIAELIAAADKNMYCAKRSHCSTV